MRKRCCQASSDPLATYTEQILPGQTPAGGTLYFEPVHVARSDHRAADGWPYFSRGAGFGARAEQDTTVTNPARNTVLNWLTRLLEQSSRTRRTVVTIVQILIFLSSGIAAFLLRFDFRIPASEWSHL